MEKPPNLSGIQDFQGILEIFIPVLFQISDASKKPFFFLDLFNISQKKRVVKNHHRKRVLFLCLDNSMFVAQWPLIQTFRDQEKKNSEGLVTLGRQKDSKSPKSSNRPRAIF